MKIMEDKITLVTEINEKINTFYDKAYGEKHILHNLKHTKWQFRDNPYYKGTNFSLVIISSENIVFYNLSTLNQKILSRNELIITTKLCKLF